MKSFINSNKIDAKCVEKSRKLIPEYIVLSSHEYNQIANYFEDNTTINLPSLGAAELEFPLDGGLQYQLRHGSQEGENINYFYWRQPVAPPSYSKQIVTEDGNIVGTRDFQFLPILKESSVQWRAQTNKISREHYQPGFDTIFWSGFTDEVKKILHVDSISLRVTSFDKVLMDKKEYSESGEIKLEGTFIINVYNGGYHGNYITLVITPDILTHKVYEVVGYEFVSCNWVE